MKTKHITSARRPWRFLTSGRLLAGIATFGLLFGPPVSLQAQTYTNGSNWNGGSGVNNWGTAVNWSPNTVPSAIDAAASFNEISNGIAVNGNLTLNGAYTVGSLWSTNSSGWLIKYGTGAGTLTLQTTPPSQPLFYMGSSSSQCWFQSGLIAGTQGFVFNSATASQKMSFRYNGNFMTGFSGPIVVGNGNLGFNTAGNFGYASSITLSNGTQITYENANTVPAPTATFASVPIILAGTTATIYNNGVGALMIQGPVQSPGTNTTLIVNGQTTILAGANTYPGNTTVSGGTLISSTASTGAGSHTVAVSATDGALVTAAGTSLIISNLTLTATTAANSSALAFCPGTAGVPTVPLINVTNLLTLGNTNFTTPIKLFGGGWQVGSSIPLLHFGNVTNVFTNGLFNGFQLAAVPAGISAALEDGTATNQINLNVTAITPLIWASATANANWATNGKWTLSGNATNYTEAYAGFGPAVVFDDSLTPAGSVIVTNNASVSPNSIVFSNSTHNYTLLGNGGFQNNASLTMSGPGYVTNSLNNVYLGGTFLNAGTMVLNSAFALPSNAGQISFGGGTLQFSANNKNDYSSRFSTAANQLFSLNTGGQNITLATGLASTGGSLTRMGTGTVTLSGASSYTGATTNAAGTLKLGIANAIPTTSALTLGSSGNSAILDLAGFSQQVTGLTMDPAATAATITNSSAVNPATFTFNGGTSSYGGIIADGSKTIGLTVGGGSLTLTGANAYHGNTLITNSGTLVIGLGSTLTTSNIFVGSGSTFDDSANNYTTLAGGSISGIGAVNGSVAVVALSSVKGGFYGAVTNHGSLTFNNNLTLDTGAACNLNVDATVASANNDKIVVGGTLSANDPSGNVINLTGPAAALATGTDYTLITSPNAIVGTFNAVPNWVGPTIPSNSAHYSVVTSANVVTLHYSTGVLLSGAGAVTPANGVHQPYLFTVLVTPGTGSTGIGVTADFTSIGGTVQTFSGVGNLFSYDYTVPATLAPGTYSIPFTVTDAQADSYSGSMSVTIANGTLVWDGAAADNNWSSTNWLNGAMPDKSGGAGDALLFAGSTRLSPVMDSSYNVSAVIFSNNAGAFVITNDINAGTVTLAAGGTVENDSSNPEQLNVPINLAGSAQFVTPAGGLTVGAIGGSAGFTKTGSGKLTVAGASTYSGNATVSGGTLAISGGDNMLPTGSGVINTAAAKLDLGGYNQTLGDVEAASGSTDYVTNGNLTIAKATAYNAFSGQASSSTLNMGGLSSFSYEGPGDFLINGNTTTAGQTYNLYLAAGSNYVNAQQVQIGAGGNTGVPTANLYLGATNIFNTYKFEVGAYRGIGNVYFQSGLVSSNLTLRAPDGVSACLTMYLPYESSGGSYSQTMDLGAANVDALVTDCYIPYALQPSETGTLKFGNGIFNITTLHLAASSQGSTGSGTYGNVIQSGGNALISTLNMGEALVGNGFTNAYFPTYTLAGGTLNAATITGTATALYAAANSVRNLNMSGGTLATYDSATDLTISGEDATSAGVINIVLGVNTTSTFFADTSRLIDAQVATVVKGSGHLNKTGAGKLFLEGTNTYTGNTTVSAGTLEIAQPTLFWHSSVSVSNGALLQLDFPGTNQIAALVINGVSQAPGVYSSNNVSTYITNAGSLLVVPLETNAYLTSLALNPTDSLTPNFATNVFVYYATNAFGIKPTVTITNADLTASNVLIVNGLTFQVLTSGVPSQPITLGVGATNVVKVLVTAQDWVTTNLYTVNLTQVAARTNAFLTSLALNPTDNLTPNFATNLFVYYATNAFGITPTLTVLNADAAATNKFTVNGLAYQLTSGIPSLVLTNFGVGATNVLKVLVTAQDGVTTNLYTVNLTELAAVTVNTNTFVITNIVSGGSLNLSWPADRMGWRLQVQTNSLNTGLGNVWYDWPNSTNLTSVSVPLNPTDPSVFLRMIYP